MAAHPSAVPRTPAPLTYREARPGPALRHAIACYWEIQGQAAPIDGPTQRILPDACIDVLFDLQAWRHAGSRKAARLIGTMTRALCSPVSGAMHLFGIRFRPGGAVMFCADPLQQLTDSTAPADNWLGAAAGSLLRRLAVAPVMAERVRVMERFLLREYQRHALDARVLTATRLIEHGDGTPATIAGVARDVGLGERQLERRFLAATGLTPAVYRRVRRFRRFLQIVEEGRARNLADAAVAAGYFDQSHMTREFTGFAGLSPRAWRARQPEVGFVQEGEVTVL